MKVSIITADGTRIPAKRPGEADFVEIAKCPACGCAPTTVRGRGVTHHDNGYGADRDTYYARALALCCAIEIGEMQAKVDTMFGIDEDNAVLMHGRCRVYGGGQ